MTVLMFQERFAAPILAGTKKQTIRPVRKRPLMIGESLSLRRWAGKAYRSRMVTIKETSVLAVLPINIAVEGIIWLQTQETYGWIRIDPLKLNEFARGDGFESWADMKAYLTAPGGYGLPFTGVLIQWE